MPITVGQLAALPDLGLTVRTSTAPVEREVRWVAVSEHADPTPWLEPGDLLLTTGMSLTGSAAELRAYVARLVAADVAGLGFGVGLEHEEVPPHLLAAAEKQGLPVLEVPRPVPFVALGKAVSRLLSAEEYRDAATSFDGQRRLIRAALADEGEAGIVAVLAKHVGGFALHLDSAGDTVSAHPPAAAARVVEFSGEVDRLRPRGLLASASISTADEHVVILPIGVRGTADGFLVVGSTRPLRSADQSVTNLAVSLLSWEGSQPRARDEAMDPWRRLLVSVALERGLRADLLAEVGLPALAPTRAVALVWRGSASDPVPESVLTGAQAAGTVLLCRRGLDAIGFATVGQDGELPAAVTALATAPGVRAVGVSCALDLSDAVNVRQALDQADRAAALGTGLSRFADAPARGLVSLIDAATTATWAVGYLGDLMTTAEGPELLDTLRAWLEQHGQVDAAAHRLGIHRHTVRHRLRRAEGVLGRSLDDPAVRADLWFALEAVRRAPAAVPGERG